MLRRRTLLVAMSALAGRALGDTKKESPALRFGVLPYLPMKNVVSAYTPVGTALEKGLKRKVVVSTSTDLEAFARQVFGGEFDVALSAPHYGRIAELDFGYSLLLTYRQRNEALLVTSSKEPLAQLEDLRGKSIALIGRSAILGILASQWLGDHGLTEGKDYEFVEATNNFYALRMALGGKARAAIIWRSILQKSPPELQKELVSFGDVLYSAPSYSLIANLRLPEEDRSAVKQALVSFDQSDEGRAFFSSMGHGGFSEPVADDLKLLDRVLPETRRLLKQSK